MAGKDVAAKAATGEPQPPKKSVARRLSRVARAVLYVLRHGGVLPSGRRVAVDLGLLLRRRARGKVAGRDFGGLVNYQCQHHVGFSSSSTAAAAKRRVSSCRHGDDEAAEYYYDNCDAADIARVLEMLNDDDSGHLFDEDALAVATPSPALWTDPSAPFGQSPAATGADAADEQQEQVDRKADEFIRRFYEQLRAQRSVAATPNYYGYGAATSYDGCSHSPRPVAAGIA